MGLLPSTLGISRRLLESHRRTLCDGEATRRWTTRWFKPRAHHKIHLARSCVSATYPASGRNDPGPLRACPHGFSHWTQTTRHQQAQPQAASAAIQTKASTRSTKVPKAPNVITNARIAGEHHAPDLRREALEPRDTTKNRSTRDQAFSPGGGMHDISPTSLSLLFC